MEYNIIWIGKYQEQMSNFKILGSISKFGIEKSNHFVYNPSIYNDYVEYVVEKVRYFLNIYTNIKIYFYDQSFAYVINKYVNIKNNQICVNTENILLWLNNKSITREWIRNIVKTPETVVLSQEEISIDYLKNIFWGYRRFIAQDMVSSGGKRTFLIDNNYSNSLSNGLYIVSPYYETSLSINITSLIYHTNAFSFPISIQIIEEEKGKLLYKGSDFISTNFISQKLTDKLRQTNNKILNNLRFLGYRGICGIDFLLYNDEVYFLEINPRFQGSSFLIDKALTQHKLSLHQLNINCFYDQIEDTTIEDLSQIYISYCFKTNMNERIIIKTPIAQIQMDNLPIDYYDYFADKYHIMLKDWTKKIDTQGKQLKHILEKYSRIGISSILDCTCGIGIQALSLAMEGFCVTGSDLSQNELNFANKEAQRRNLNIDFIQADCRYLEDSIKHKFDAVISIDSALPHLLTRENFLLAFRSIFKRLNKGGVFLSSYRDYEALLKTKPNMAYPVRFNNENGIEYTILRKWNWEGNHIYSKQYVIADFPSGSKLYSNTYTQWAITKKELIDIAIESDYSECYWLLPDDSGFTQPILCLVK